MNIDQYSRYLLPIDIDSKYMIPTNCITDLDTNLSLMQFILHGVAIIAFMLS